LSIVYCIRVHVFLEKANINPNHLVLKKYVNGNVFSGVTMEHEFDHEREHECLHGSIPAYIILDSTTNDRTTTKNCDKIDYWTLKTAGEM